MKKFFFYLFVLLILGCSQTFIPCTSGEINLDAKTLMMPVKTGNTWLYDEFEFSLGGDVLNKRERAIEIGGIDTVIYQDKNGTKEAYIFSILMNDVKLEYYGYLKCSDGAVFVTINKVGQYRQLVSGRTIPNEPAVNWIDPKDDKVLWRGKDTITVPAGTFECWYCEWLDEQWNIRREYYAKGVGLVKSERFTKHRTLLGKMELVKYIVD